MIETQYVSHRTIDSAYIEIGNGDGVPFLLVHGFTGSKLDFRDQITWFSAHRRVLAVDQRGHGESSKSRPYSLEVLTTDLLNFVDALGLQRFHLLGHSMGGMVAMRFAIEHGDRLASLILMDTAAEPLTILPPAVRKSINESVLNEGMSGRIKWMKTLPVSAAAQRGIDYLSSLHGEGEHWRRIEEKLRQMDPHAFIDLADAMAAAAPALASLEGIAAPTTIIVGEHDTPFIEPSAGMAARIANAKLVTVPLAAHSPQYENADAWRATIETHLQRSTP